MVQAYATVVILAIVALAMSGYAFTEARVAQAQHGSTQALFLAEAGVDRAITELRNDYGWMEGFDGESYGDWGSYSVDVEADGDLQILTATGTVSAGGQFAQRTIQATVRSDLPNNFYDYAIYSSDEVTFKGNTYEVGGDVLSGDVNETIDNTTHVSGDIDYDETANPLPRVNFEKLYEMAEGQGNIYDADRLQDIQRGWDNFPASFWRTPPGPGVPGVPNIVYVTTDLTLNGNIGTIGGFFVVAGNVVTDPNAVEDATLNGNGTVDGPVYTRGTFSINGGAGRLNIRGGVWAGVEARLNGNATVNYDQEYMDALRDLIEGDVELVLWREAT